MVEGSSFSSDDVPSNLLLVLSSPNVVPVLVTEGDGGAVVVIASVLGGSVVGDFGLSAVAFVGAGDGEGDGKGAGLGEPEISVVVAVAMFVVVVVVVVVGDKHGQMRIRVPNLRLHRGSTPLVKVLPYTHCWPTVLPLLHCESPPVGTTTGAWPKSLR